MICSMTGFGRSSRIVAGLRIEVEVKSVNHRYAETAVRMPREWMAYENALKKHIAQQVRRGRVDVFVNVGREGGTGARIELDWDLAKGYVEAASQLQQQFGLQEGLKVSDLLQVPELFRLVEDKDPELLGQEILACAGDAVDQLVAMRQAEGDHLRQALLDRLRVLKTLHSQVQALSHVVVEEYRSKLTLRLQELLGQLPLDENRLAMEIALFADRCSVDEELIRLQSHFKQFEMILQSESQQKTSPSEAQHREGGQFGRKLDFIIQEMNREVNTIGSKAHSAELTAIIVDMKAELEKIREQVQNIE